MHRETQLSQSKIRLFFYLISIMVNRNANNEEWINLNLLLFKDCCFK